MILAALLESYLKMDFYEWLAYLEIKNGIKLIIYSKQ